MQKKSCVNLAPGPLGSCTVDIADVHLEERVDDVVGERVEHGQGHVSQDEEGDEHGNESRTEQVLRHEVEDDVGQDAHGVAEPALADLDDPQVLEGKQGYLYTHSLKDLCTSIV